MLIRIVNKITALACFITVCSYSLWAENTQVIFLAGTKSHKPGEHEFNAGCQLLANALNNESNLPIEAQVIQGWPQDTSVLEQADAIVFYNDAAKIVKHDWKLIDRLAREGTGLMFIHYAVHPSPDKGERYFLPWIGGFFETGTSANPHWIGSLTGKAGHPVSNGVQYPITALDEFYYNMRFSQDACCEVKHLITATPTTDSFTHVGGHWTQDSIEGIGKPQTLMWAIEREDGGRGVGFTGGHYHWNWAIDDFRKNVLNAIVWVAQMEVPAEGVQSKPISNEQLNQNIDGVSAKPIRVPTQAELDKMKRVQSPEKIAPKKGKNSVSIDKAIAMGDLALVSQLIQDNPTNIHQGARPGFSPLQQAILRNKTDIAHLLIDSGANIDEVGRNQQSLVHIAVSRKNTEILKRLLDEGANPNLHDKVGWTPLHHAAAKNSYEVAVLLLESKRIKPYTLSELGGTALHEAAVGSDEALLQLLLKQGLDPHVVSKTGVTALDIAKEYKNAAAISVLSKVTQ